MAGRSTISTTGVLYINGTQVENTFQNLNRITRNLERELRRLPVGTREFNARAEELRQARQRFQEVRNEIDSLSGTLNNASGFLGLFRNGLLRFGDTFREVFSANMAERFFDVIIDKGKETVDQLLKISDAMTDVEKTTGMSTDQVKDLWTQFDAMDTRTNKLERLKIAEVGGRLGVPIEEMKDFVQEVDKAYVALGDSFEGGLEGVVDQLGKIKGLFNGTKELSYAEAINRIGSALNTLAAAGTASEGNIAQFALRVGNLPEALRPSIDKVLGLGAAFEESGIDAQIAASGFSNFISQAGEGIEGFAISMHMSSKEAQNLLNTKPEEFFLRFAQGMKGLSATETAKVFSSLKLNSLEVQKAIGAAANKTEEFKKAMKTAGIEMDKMTSLSDEFNKKNNNAPAILEKIKNAFNDTFTSTQIINKFESLIQAVGWLTGVTDESGNGMIIFKERLTALYKIIIVLISGVIGYNAAMLILVLTTKNAARETLIYNLVQKAKAAWDAIARATTLLVAVAYNLLTGNIVRATVAMRAFNIATKANLIGILVGVITAVVVAIALFSKEVDEAAAKQKMLNEINKDAEKGIISQKRELEQLVKIAKDENYSKELRADAIQKLNKLSPEYLGNLTLENIRTQEATNAIKAYTDALLKNSKIKVLNKKLDEINEKIIDEKDKPLKDIAKDHGDWVDRNMSFLTPSEIKFMDKDQRKQFDAWKKKGGDEYAKQMMDAYGYIYEKRNQAIQKLSNDANILSEQIADLSAVPSIDENSVPKNIALPDKKKDKDPNKKNKDDLEKARDAYNKANDAKAEADKKAGELERILIDEQFKIWEENKQKEWDVELQDYENRKNELKQQTTEFKNQIKKTNDEIKKLERDKKETKNPTAAAEFGYAIAGLQEANKKRQGLIEANAKMEDQIFQTHGFNLLRIEEKYQTKSYEKQVENLQSKIDLERKSTEDSINNITTMDEAREALSKMSYLKLTEIELKAIQTLEDAKKALRENADRAYLKSQENFLIEQQKLLERLLQDPSLSSEATEKLKKDLEELKIKITEVRSAMTGGKESDDKKVKEESDTEKEKLDILGFSGKDWETAWKNLETTKGKLGALKMVIQALGNAFQAYYQLQNALAEREMARFEKNNDKKKKELLGQLNAGLINQEEYNKKLQGLDVETANKKAEIAYKQAKTERALKVAEIIANTSLAIMQAYSQLGPIGGTVAAVLIGTLGAIQLGTVLSTPLPDKPTFYQGGHTGRGFGSPDETGHVPAGIVHANEWVAPAWMLEDPKTAQVIDYLESVRQGKTKPFAAGGFTESTSENPNINPSQPQINLIDVVSQNLEVMAELKNLLQKIDDEGGIEAYMIADAKNGKLFKKATKEFEIIENRNARK
ncbi:phage tail tape measure protein [Chryseobacterium sp. NRRL B-14859]|uniref:phage tail tape measure protein n=1 Tax=Chryseobacterium sp. NRRL B-14859 TaxID=1562763 RepID=UPI003397D967